MSLCYGLGHYSNYEENLAMSILCDVLLGKNDAPENWHEITKEEYEEIKKAEEAEE